MDSSNLAVAHLLDEAERLVERVQLVAVDLALQGLGASW
jgi:hypothetical protein